MEADKKTVRTGAERFVTVIVGLAWGFFGAVNIVFSDSGSVWKFLAAVVVVSLVFLVMGIVAGIASPADGWKGGLWLGVPAVVLLAGFVVLEPNAVASVALTAVGSLAGACGGAAIGTILRRRMDGLRQES